MDGTRGRVQNLAGNGGGAPGLALIRRFGIALGVALDGGGGKVRRNIEKLV